MDAFIPALKGWRNGFYYGGKIRLIHSLVMTLLFKTLDRKSVRSIVQLTLQHASNLGRFAFIYKTTCILLGKTFWENPWNSFVSGVVGGFAVFSQKTPVNYQIVLYLFSRIVMGLGYLIYKSINKKRMYSDRSREQKQKLYFRIASGVAWGIIMFLFAYDRTLIQPSISSSMEFIYQQSDRPYKNWKQLVPIKIPW